MCDLLENVIFQFLYTFFQITYLIGFAVDMYIYSRPRDLVDMSKAKDLKDGDYPFIVLFYPVLRELEETMHTTFKTISKVDYPKDRYKVIAIPNSNDMTTIESLKRLQKEFDFLEIMEIPPTTDPSWQVVWDNWENNDKVYWWHEGVRAKNKNLPPKKTRQLIYAFYHVAKEFEGKEDFLVNYIDADTCIPEDHFLAGAVGIKQYDVLQATNIAGNLNYSMAASCHAFDHFVWDGFKYLHLTDHGKHPYWVLGKALFYKASDLLELGGFHPWIAIEDPEVGMRFWKYGRKLGIIEKAVIEEVPSTFWIGVTQRKRWICGFFQSLTEPLTRLKMTPLEKLKCWINVIPCLTLWVNAFALPSSIWALYVYLHHYPCLPMPIVVLSIFNIITTVILLLVIYYKVWKRTKLISENVWTRIWYLIRINPIVAMLWWVFWLVPITIGFYMYKTEGGLEWIRTEKINANVDLIKSGFLRWFSKK